MNNLAEFLDELPDTPAAYVPRTNYNGHGFAVDVMVARDFVGDRGKIVVTDIGNMDLTHTIGYHIKLSMTEVEVTSNAVVTADHVRSASPYICVACNIWNFYRIFAAARIDIRVRRSDCADAGFRDHLAPVIVAAEAPVPVDARGGGVEEAKDEEKEDILDAADVPVVAAVVETDTNIWATAKRIECAAFTVSSFAEVVASSGRHVLHCLIANAIHRHVTEGHNWITEAANRPNTQTSRCLAVAGADAIPFRAFMTTHGHDSLHHLSTASMNDIATALCPDSENAQRTVRIDVNYIGVNVSGRRIDDIFKVSEAASNRWPVGVMGKSAVILGLSATNAMIADISTVVKFSSSRTITGGIDRLSQTVKSSTFTRDNLAAIRIVLPEVLAVAYGYVRARRMRAYDNKASLDAVKEQNLAAYATGEALATAIERSPVHSDAVSSSVLNALARIETALLSCNTVVTDTPYVRVPAAELVIELGKDPALVAHDRMIQTLNASNRTTNNTPTA